MTVDHQTRLLSYVKSNLIMRDIYLDLLLDSNNPV